MIAWCCIVSRKIPFHGDSCFFIALFVGNGRFVIQAVRKAQKGDARCKKAGRKADRYIEEQGTGK